MVLIHDGLLSATIGVLAVILNARPANAIPPGAVALAEWFDRTLPRIFPNTTDGWQECFEDGTFHPNVVGSYNTLPINGLAELKGLGALISSLATEQLEYFVLEPTATVAFATDEAGHSGLITYTGKSSLKTKSGAVYADGLSSVSVTVEWNEALQKRAITVWKEVSTPPNFPDYPWDVLTAAEQHSEPSMGRAVGEL
ncbi:hypothetical protein DFP72DRAFT_1168687 [Ephemerocybe angulata]|uniref:SnoaL-like domain-containing protein n=1 Tax=Ephemerocybe angulata TaxID=980116 RepID=A0A8H6M5Y1_9AGAR|nr:hypothetical protein DFP72DRAFT_1168687 [Tulosesus angulatus]